MRWQINCIHVYPLLMLLFHNYRR